MVREISEGEFEEAIKSNEVVIVDCYANWCPPCRMLAPILDELEEEFKKEGESRISIVKLNVDEANEIAEKFGISAIPTLLIFKNGKLENRIVGLYPKSILKTQIQQLL